MDTLPVVVSPEWSSAVACLNLGHLEAALARPDLWQELQLLEKLLYKNANQHRGAQHFQRLQEVRRLLGLLRAARLDQHAAALHAALDAAKQRGAPPAGGILMAYGGDRRQVPSHAAAARVLRALLAGCRLVEELAPAVHRASLQLLAQLAHSFFMPLCLASLAALARIQVLAGQLLLDAVRAYNAVAEAAALLPSSQAAADAADAADTAGGGDGGELPQMLRAQWRGGLPQLDCVPCEPGDGLAAQAAAACARYALHVVQPEALQPRPATVLEEVAAPGAQQAQRRRGRQPAAPAPALAVVEDRGVPISREAFAAAAAAQAAAKAQDAAPAAAPAAAAAELAEPAHTPAAAPPVLLGVVEDAVVEQRTRNGAVEVSSLMGGEARGHLYRRTTAVLGLGGPQAQQQAQPEEAQQRAPQGVQQQQRQPAKPAAALAALAAPKPPAAASKPAFLAVGALAAKPAAAARPAFVSVAVQPAKLAGVAAEPAAAAGAPAAAAGAPAAPAAQPAAPAAQPAAQPALGGAAGRKRKKAAAAAEAPATEAAAAEPKSWEDWLDPLGGGLGGGPAAAASPAQPGAKPQQGKRRRGR